MIRRLATLALFVAACRAPGQTTLALGNVEIIRVDRAASTSPRGLAPGDWELRTGGLQVQVAGPDRIVRAGRPGTVLRLVDPASPGVEPLRGVDFFVAVGDVDLEAASTRFEALVVDGLPLLRVTARYRRGDVALALTREYQPDPARHALRVHTRVVNLGAQPLRGLRFGARITWGDELPFAPGLGAHESAQDGRVPWVGVSERNVAVGWSRENGADIAARFDTERHDGAAFVSGTSVDHGPLVLLPGGAVSDRELLTLTTGPLGALHRAVLRARGATVRDVAIDVRGADRNAATVHVVTADGAPVLQTPPTRAHAQVPLVPGQYRAWVTAPGSSAGDTVPFTVPAVDGDVPRVELALPPGGSIRVVAIDADEGAALPVRVTVRGVAGTADPMFGPLHRGAGAGVVAVAAGGTIDLPVAPGTYSVTVSHGPQWTLAEQRVQVTDSQRGDVRAGLRRVIPMDAWVACDLHVHAARSFDSRVSIADRVASLVAEDVRFATPTEHNRVGSYAEGVQLLPEGITQTLQWVPAVEVTTDRSAQPWGHFNVYPYAPREGLPEGGPPPFSNVPPREIFAAARARSPGAIIQVNHPRMQPNIGYFDVTGLDPRTGRAVSPVYDPNYDAIEVFNGFYIGQVDAVERVLRDWLQLLQTGRRYLATGSSDSHTIAYQWAGYPRTMVHLHPGDDPRDDAAILRSLRDGRAFVTSGPMLQLTVEGHEPGEPFAMPAAARLRVRVVVSAPPWMHLSQVEILRRSDVVERLDVPDGTAAVRLDRTVEIPLEPGDFVVATARGPQGDLEQVLPFSRGVPYAFTNPVFIERVER